MSKTAPEPAERAERVAAYKECLLKIVESRPSGMRQRLATALGKNRSFISQITNPLYPTPIPAAHLDVIFDVCHASAEERRSFFALYHLVHPKRGASEGRRSKSQTHSLSLPDLGDADANAKLHAIMSEMVRGVAALISEQRRRDLK
jgi:hypothetical protein